jgi:hypothetical protein
VVSPYGEDGYVEIASDAEGFIKAAERILSTPKEDWLKRVDQFLSFQSWSLTYKGMMKNVVQTLSNKYAKPTAVKKLSTVE